MQLVYMIGCYIFVVFDKSVYMYIGEKTSSKEKSSPRYVCLQ